MPRSGFGTDVIGRGRVLEAEWLEAAPRKEADRNLRDLVRLNKWFGGQRAILQVFQRLVGPQDRFSVLDVGAASGDLGRCLRRRYKNATVLSLDHRILHLQRAAQPRIAADGFALPFRRRSFDFVFCSLLLHHFTHRRAVTLLRELRCCTRRALVVVDLERHPFAYFFLPLTRRLFDWTELTVHDGCVSVAAGFKPDELRAIALDAGVEKTHMHRHWPWCRISMVIPSGRDHESALWAGAIAS